MHFHTPTVSKAQWFRYRGDVDIFHIHITIIFSITIYELLINLNRYNQAIVIKISKIDISIFLIIIILVILFHSIVIIKANIISITIYELLINFNRYNQAIVIKI